MTRYDSMASAEAWDEVVGEYQSLTPDEKAHHFTVAEILREAIIRIEGANDDD